MKWDIRTNEKTSLLLNKDTDTEDDQDTPWYQSFLGKAYLLGCLFALVAAILRTVTFLTVQMLDDLSSVFQLGFGKYSIMFLCNLVYVLTTKSSKDKVLLMKSCVLLQCAFSVSTLSLTMCSYLAVIHIPVGTAVCVSYVSFVSTMLLVYLVNRWCSDTDIVWKWTAVEIVALSILFASLVFMIQPQGAFHVFPYFRHRTNYSSICNPGRFDVNGTELSDYEKTKLYSSVSWRGYLFAIVAGICNTLAVVCKRELQKYEQVHTVLFWASAINGILCLLVTIGIGGFVFPTEASCIALLLINAICSGLQNNVFLESVKYTPPTDAAVIASFTIAFLLASQFSLLSSVSPIPDNCVAIVAAVVFFLVAAVKPAIQLFVAYKEVG